MVRRTRVKRSAKVLPAADGWRDTELLQACSHGIFNLRLRSPRHLGHRSALMAHSVAFRPLTPTGCPE